MFCFPNIGPRGTWSIVFPEIILVRTSSKSHATPLDMLVNKTKFDRIGSIEY